MVRHSVALDTSERLADEFTKCKKGLGDTCGNSIHQYLFKDGKGVSKDCCTRLFIAGEDCHDLLTEVSIIYERIPVKQAKDIRRKNDKVWECCEKIGDPTRYNELKECSNALGTACGESIYKNLFGLERQVSEKCCKRLITVGEDCQDYLTLVTIAYQRLNEKKAEDIWEMKEKVWQQCEKKQ